MQNVNFKTVDEFLEFLSGDELVIVKYLRQLIFDCIPGVTEKLSYNVPFFKRNTNICFVWPGSVKWGNKGHEGVRLGFTKGYLLKDELKYLDKGDRKQVYWKDIRTANEINPDIIKMLLFEAAEIDSNNKS